MAGQMTSCRERVVYATKIVESPFRQTKKSLIKLLRPPVRFHHPIPPKTTRPMPAAAKQTDNSSKRQNKENEGIVTTPRETPKRNRRQTEKVKETGE
jgi:hypothetical protein